MESSAADAWVRAVERDGFAGPVPLFSPAECAALMTRLSSRITPPPAVWHKGVAVTSRAFHDVAADSRVLALVRPVLGEDIVLWGCHLVRKQGNAVHPFHTDCETSAPDGRFISVWVGLEHTGPKAGLKFIRGSHRFGATIQEMNARRGASRDDSSDTTTLEAARSFDAEPELVQPEVADGLALVFDGRAWHGSHNVGSDQTRTALLLQYAAADCPVFIPQTYEWPLLFKSEPRPPVLVVSGRAPIGVNRIVLPPSQGLSDRVPNAAYRLPVQPKAPAGQFDSLPHLRGRTPILAELEAHSSVLAPGASPHALHTHREEEILVVIDGEAELMVADDHEGTNLRRERMGPGDFAYYPAFQPHTLVNSGSTPVLYSMFKWWNAKRPTSAALPLSFFRASEALAAVADPERRNQGALFEARTRWLRRLHCHVSIAAPGVGYAEHADRYDVAIVLISGVIETLGETVAAPALLYHPAGQLHGMRSVGPEAARYLVFELDGRVRSHPLAMFRRLKQVLRPYVKPMLSRIRRMLRGRP